VAVTHLPTAIASKLAPTGFCGVFMSYAHRWTYCGSELARDEASTANLTASSVSYKLNRPRSSSVSR
jgi:hypothetical protein